MNHDEDASDFYRAQEHHPPDMMKRIIDMMELVMEKVAALEKSNKISQ